MASAVHAVTPPYPPPTFSHNSTDSSMNGMHLSQPQMNSFEAAQSIASTPTVTPPASRGHQHIMPLNMANYGATNGTHFPQTNSRGLGEMNGHVPQQRNPPGHKPQIYTVRLPESGNWVLCDFLLTPQMIQGRVLGCLGLRNGSEPSYCDASKA